MFIQIIKIYRGGVRVWVYRIICPVNNNQQAQQESQQEQIVDQRQQQKQFDAATIEAARQHA